MKVWMKDYDKSFEAVEQEYYVEVSRLYEEDYYGPDGMWDHKSPMPLNEYKIEVSRARGNYYDGETAVLDLDFDKDKYNRSSMNFFYINLRNDNIPFENVVRKAIELGGAYKEEKHLAC